MEASCVSPTRDRDNLQRRGQRPQLLHRLDAFLLWHHEVCHHQRHGVRLPARDTFPPMAGLMHRIASFLQDCPEGSP